jgi:hypothetical protein
MKKILLTLFALCAAVVSAQVLTPGVVVQTTDPTGNCSVQSYKFIINSADQLLWICNTTTNQYVSTPIAWGAGSTTTTSAAEKVLLTTTTDVIIGTAIGENAGTAKIFVGNAGTYHSIQMPFTGSQPSGGFIGDSITCTDIAAGTWACQVIYQAGTTPTTPYSTSTT